jgi:uncharacterized protein YodC (DUF2158 family)
LEVTGFDEVHNSLEVMITFTASLLDGLYVNIPESVPTLTPFTCHWYDGPEPPLVGVALYVTGVPSHSLLVEDEILTEETNNGITVMLIVLDVAKIPEVQTSVDVIITFTVSLLDGLYVYVLKLMPAIVPFTCHWYDGLAPPLVGVAVNVTGIPSHSLLVEAWMLTETDMFVFTSTCTITLFDMLSDSILLTALFSKSVLWIIPSVSTAFPSIELNSLPKDFAALDVFCST